jgi:nucleotide-binding universal stress UspA family protein
MFQRIVVPLDGSSFAEAALPYAQDIAQKFGATLDLVQVIGTEEMLLSSQPIDPTGAGAMMFDPGPIIDAEKAEATKYLDGVATRVRAAGLTVNTSIPGGSSGDALVEYAHTNKADLVVITSHGRSGLGRIVMGSTTDHVIRNLEIPVMVIRVKEHKR